MKRTVLILFTLLIRITCFGQVINSTIERDIIHSDILNDDSEISVYLPPSYSATNQNFPVLYILDGDYNFFYVSGLLELQSSISENIPEMILIGISGKGSETYRTNCKPNIDTIKGKGNADQYADFIETELVPFVNTKYRTSNYKLLAGHSAGGLFIMNTVLQKPNAFNAYIAISPSLWWEKNVMNDVAIQTFKSNPNFSSNVYVSLANEKGMGVDKFLEVVKDNNISDSVFKFKHFTDENHNSVGLPSYLWALKDIFIPWKGEKEYFEKTSELKDYHTNMLKAYGSAFNIQNSLLMYTIYVLREDAAELEKMQAEIKQLYPEAVAKFDNFWVQRLISMDKNAEAEALLQKSIKEHPDFFDSYNTLSKLKLKNKEFKIAEGLINKGIELAITQKARQWQLNELLETKEKIEAAD